MQEVTVRIRFTSPSLGNLKRDGRFVFQRGPNGRILFLPTWHRGYLQPAAELLGCYGALVPRIFWDQHLDCRLRPDPWYKVYVHKGRRQNYRLHEALFGGQTAGINCVLPLELPLEGFAKLMERAGRYWGASPWHNPDRGRWGLFEVLSVDPRRPLLREREDDDASEVKPGPAVPPAGPGSVW